ncbi:MAG TPA: polysaccharide lyase family protein [Pirellulales bacterium]|jgi:rhamnogalacturonan endolyase|nr:polysaccharide lyase family protein [Pirellulales bacterium]
MLAMAVSVLRAADVAPVVAKSEVNVPVTAIDNGNNWTLDNGIVKATVNKRSGNMRSLIYHGIETMSAGGIWEQTPQLAPQLTETLTIDPANNGGERAEVAVKGVTGGTVLLTPSAPGGGTYCDIEIRCALGRGESGIYTYAIFSHPAAYGAMGIGESRFITFLSKTFDWLSVDADRNLLECAPRDWGTGVVVHAKEQRILSQGVYKNSVEHKYSYNAIQYKIPAYGWSSTKDHIGVWFINPTIEYLSGGASKQELVCHYHDNDNPDPIILDYWRGTHYGGASCTMDAGEEWSKVIGPIFVYCNSLSNPQVPTKTDLDTLAATAGNPTVPAAWKDNATMLWQDALSQAKKEKALWPYDWVNGVDYPHKDERGTVTGQIVLNDPQATTTKLPNLTVGLAHPDYTRGNRRGGPPQAAGSATAPVGARRGFGRGSGMVDWAHDAKFYQFWNDGSEDGKFTITNVRPGAYSLHAFADGVLGEFAQTDITVEAGKTLELSKLEWQPVRYGKQVWDIGYPDRTGDKFYKGDGDNYWLWGWCLRYPLLFPNDITYTIGKSDYHKDWFFEQVPHGDSLAWLNSEAKDPANQRFGWVKAESLDTYPQSDTTGPWRTYGRGRATTWTIKFNMETAPKGQAALRVALAGADGYGGLAVAVNGQSAGTIRPMATNALRYNTNKSVWQELTLTFDATLMKQGENEMQLTVPAGQLTSGVVYDYLRLELNEDYKPDNSSVPPAKL